MSDKTGWQPIETAPKDGTRIIGGAWLQYDDREWRVWETRWASDHWVLAPTHWVPFSVLPDPPSETPP